MKKILVVFTGGTIGSKLNNKIIDVDKSLAYYLLDCYNNSNLKREVEFDTIHPLNILSENLVPNDWITMYNTISKIDSSKYQGIIITHGSDTLPFTSTALSYLLNQTDIPIVITASNRPLEDKNSNGLRNFINSVNFIIDNNIPGIFVVFENNAGQSTVHLGTRLTEASPFNHAFDSFNSLTFGNNTDKGFVRNTHKLNPEVSMFKEKHEKFKCSNINFSSDILYISPRPGLNYKFFDFSKIKPKAVLHDLYHSGTACTRITPDHYYSLIDFTKYCAVHDVDIYISPITNVSDNLYASSDLLIKYGGFPLQNISVEAAIVKLMLAYGSLDNKKQIYEFLNNKTLFFEYIDNVCGQHLLGRKINQVG